MCYQNGAPEEAQKAFQLKEEKELLCMLDGSDCTISELSHLVNMCRRRWGANQPLLLHVMGNQLAKRGW